VRAVIFDLWDTLVDWPVEEGERLKRDLADEIDVEWREFEHRWRESYRASQTGSLAAVYRELGVAEAHVERHVAARHEFARRALRLRPGAGETLEELRRRGIKIGLISVCSEEVPAVWPETELAGRFDVETFSSDCGLMKPEPEIYLHTARALGVEPGDCWFVGDGANDELGGAARVGMTPVLFVADGGDPYWQEVRNWTGLRVSSVVQVLELVIAAGAEPASIGEV
jgi:putative hydrolase of the HAD superfamily